MAEIRVAQIILGLNTGGLEQVVLNLLKKLDRRLCEPFLICLEDQFDLISDQGLPDVKVLRVRKKSGRDPAAMARLARLLRQLRIDIAHTHNPVPHFYGAIAARLSGVPVVIHTKHGRNYPRNSRKVLLNRLLAYLTDRVIAVSDDSRRVAVEVEGIESEKVITILNGIETSRYRQNHNGDRLERLRSELEIVDGNLIIGIVARLSPEKDHRTLLLAFKLVAQQRKDCLLLVVGDGPLLEPMKSFAQRLGLVGRVIFAGQRSDVPDLLQLMDLFVLSSTTEGISLTLIEAMSAGLPVVATSVGGNPEVVVDGETGLLVPARDPKALANALLKLLNADRQRKAMGLRGQIRAEAVFNVDKMARAYERLYIECLTYRSRS